MYTSTTSHTTKNRSTSNYGHRKSQQHSPTRARKEKSELSSVKLIPQSIETAIKIGDLKMLYRGQIFSNEQLLNLRC